MNKLLPSKAALLGGISPGANGAPAREHQNWILSRTALAAAGLLTSLVWAHAAQAHHASTPYPFKHASIALGTAAGSSRPVEPVIHVGNNGERYTHLKGDVRIPVVIKARVRAFYRVIDWRLHPSDPNQPPNVLQPWPHGFANESRNFKKHFTLEVDADKFVSSSVPGGGIATNASQGLVDYCNSRFPNLPEANQGIAKYLYPLHVGFNSYSPHPSIKDTARMAIAWTNIPVRIVCTAKAETPSINPVVGVDKGPLKVSSVALSLKTYVPLASSNIGVSCPVLTLDVKFKTNQSGLVHFNLWKKIGGGSASQTPLVVQSKHQGDGTFTAQFTQQYRFNRTTYIQFMARETESLIEQSSGWKAANISCGGGSSDLATGGGTGPDPTDVLPKAKYSGSLHLASSPEANRYQCPRAGAVTAIIHSNKPTSTGYRIDCTNGQSWSGQASMTASGANAYRGVVVKTFKIQQTTNLICALKRTYDNKAQLLALGKKSFGCTTVSSVGGLVAKPDPKPGAGPTNTSNPVKDPNKIRACINGRFKAGHCKCRGNRRPVRFGPFHWRCPKRIVDPPRPHIRCVNGTARNGACVCRRGQRKLRVSRNVFRCLLRPSRLSCIGGVVRKGNCACRQSHRKVRIARDTYRCVANNSALARKRHGASVRKSGQLGRLKRWERRKRLPRRGRTSRK